MKTLIIYNDLGSEIKFAIVDGDYSRFSGICVNSMEYHKYEEEFFDFMYDEKGNDKIPLSNDVSLLENKQWDKVAIISFIP